MVRYMAGCTDTKNINHCPRCGESLLTFHIDSTASCDVCGYRFGVVERGASTNKKAEPAAGGEDKQ